MAGFYPFQIFRPSELLQWGEGWDGPPRRLMEPDSFLMSLGIFRLTGLESGYGLGCRYNYSRESSSLLQTLECSLVY